MSEDFEMTPHPEEEQPAPQPQEAQEGQEAEKKPPEDLFYWLMPRHDIHAALYTFHL